MQMNDRINNALKKGTHRRVNNLMGHIEWLKEIDPELSSDVSKQLCAGLERALRRTLFGVRPQKVLEWNGRRLMATKKYSQEHLAGTEDLMFVSIDPNKVNITGVWRMVADAAKNGATIIGIKAGTSVTAVFAKTHMIQVALVKALGQKIAMQIVDKDSMKALQNAVGLLGRVGARTLVEKEIAWPTKVIEDHRPDGLLARMSEEAFHQLCECWILPKSTKWIQVTYLDKVGGHASKGGITYVSPGEEPEVYRDSWKFGCPTGVIKTSNLIIGNADSLYRPQPTMNVQALVYNYTRAEAELLIKEIFIPALEKCKDFAHFSRAHGVERLMALGMGVDLPGPDGECRARKFHRKLIRELAGKVPISGIRVKVACDTSLEPFEVRVPNYCPWAIGDKVDITRDPSLPCGNSTQRFTVVGYCKGNLIYVNTEPWTTIQAGDFDGDDATVSDLTVKLLPGKVYNQTKMVDLEMPRKAYGDVLKERARVQQAIRVISSNIGQWDLLARRAYDIDKLDVETALQISRAAQAEVMSRKHCIEKPKVKKIAGINPGVHPIDYFRQGIMDGELLKGSIYENIAKKASEVAEYWLPLKGIDQSKIKVPEVPQKVSMRMQALVATFSDSFRTLASNGANQESFERLSMRIQMKLEQIKQKNPLYREAFARYLVKGSNGNLFCKVLPLAELAEIIKDAVVAV